MDAIISMLQQIYTMLFGAASSSNAGGLFTQAFGFLTSEAVLPYVLLVVGTGLAYGAFSAIRGLIRTA